MSLDTLNLGYAHYLGILMACLPFISKEFKLTDLFFYFSFSTIIISIISIPNLTMPYALFVNGLLLLLYRDSNGQEKHFSLGKSFIFLFIVSLGQQLNIFAPIMGLCISFLFKLSYNKCLALSLISLISYSTIGIYNNFVPEQVLITIFVSLTSLVLTFFFLKFLFKKIFFLKKTISYTLLFVSLIAFYKNADTSHQYVLKTMGTEAKIIASGQNKIIFNKATKEIEEILIKTEKSLSSYREDSELTYINNNATNFPIKCSPIFWHNLMAAKQAYTTSHGLFDITVEPLLKLWGLKYFKKNTLPSNDDIDKLAKNIGFNKLIIDKQKRTIYFKNDIIKLNFGGLTKGYAIDRAITIMKKYGFQDIFINIGGNIRTVGKQRSVGILHPQTKQILTTLNIQNEAISTSGNYNRYITVDGKKYSHIINPFSGKPIENIISATVIAPTALWSDILSTTLFLLTDDVVERDKFLKNTLATRAYFVKKNPKIQTYHWKKHND